MSWLLWKDFRQNRLIVVFGLLLLLTPHLFAVYAVYQKAPEPHGMTNYMQFVFGVSSCSGFLISALTIALIAGNAIAGERADRSAEFLASLPIARNRIIASKLLLIVAVVAAIWATDGGLFAVLALVDPAEMGRLFPEWPRVFSMFAAAGIAIFGVAWLISSFTTSPMLSVWGGAVAPFAVALAMGLMTHLLGLDLSEDQAAHWFARIYVPLGIAGFIAGTWYYLRRVEP
jgi:ABC-type transport system involved in multi-copper enzyme maturation permease subunit